MCACAKHLTFIAYASFAKFQFVYDSSTQFNKRTHTFCFQTNFNQLLQIIIYMHSTPFSFHSILIYYLLDNVDKFIGSIAHCLACLEVYMAELGYLGFDKVLTITKQHQHHQQPYHWSGELLCMQTHVKRSFSTTIQTISTQHSVLQASAQQPSSHKIR